VPIAVRIRSTSLLSLLVASSAVRIVVVINTAKRICSVIVNVATVRSVGVQEEIRIRARIEGA
jgi:hypothetical protein